MAPRDLSEPQEEVVFTVPPEAEGMRLDHWLQARVPWRSRTDLQRRIRAGRILVEGVPARKALRLRAGQRVRIAIDEAAAAREAALDLDLEPVFLHEDAWLVALHKPAGVIMHPVGGNVMNTLLNAVHRHYKTAGAPIRPMIVHRIDKETSGLVVLAKDLETRKELGRAFEEREVAKSYLAIVRGRPRPDRGVIDLPLGPDLASGIKVKMGVFPEGKPSRTSYEVLASGTRFSLVNCFPHTGRQHQIRVHLAALGTPIVCDWLYGDPPPLRRSAVLGSDWPLPAEVLDPEDDPVLLDRLGLHAHRLRFFHPHLHRSVEWEAPLPADLRAFARAQIEEAAP